MGTTVTGKLNKAANQFQAGESTGFGIRIGVKFRDPKTKQDDWCNYQAVIFAKSPGQIQFYNDVLVEGAIVEVTAEQLKIDSYQGTSDVMLSIEMLNARLGYVYSPNQAPAQQQAPQHGHIPPQPQQSFQAPQQPPQQGGYGQHRG